MDEPESSPQSRRGLAGLLSRADRADSSVSSAASPTAGASNEGGDFGMQASEEPELNPLPTASKTSKKPRGSRGKKDVEGEADANGEKGENAPGEGDDQGEEDEDPGESDEEGDGDDGSGDSRDEVEWLEYFACPLTVRFTQESIHPFFYRRGPIMEVVPKIRHYALKAGTEEAEGFDVELCPPFGPIRVLRKGPHLWALDNRRLYALQVAATQRWPRRSRVRLLLSDRLPRKKFKTQYRKFNTISEGRVVQIISRYQKFDSWSWFERCVELEWYHLSRRFGAMLSAFELLPLVGIFIYRTGVTGLPSRTPLFAGFFLTFGIDFLRQRFPAVERRICELHVTAVMEGEARVCPNWVWCSGSKLRSCCKHRQNKPAPLLSVPLLAGTCLLILVLILPYMMGLTTGRLRSSLLSCWTGFVCVLLVQLSFAMGSSKEALDGSTPEGQERITPKHRD